MKKGSKDEPALHFVPGSLPYEQRYLIRRAAQGPAPQLRIFPDCGFDQVVHSCRGQNLPLLVERRLGGLSNEAHSALHEIDETRSLQQLLPNQDILPFKNSLHVRWKASVESGLFHLQLFLHLGKHSYRTGASSLTQTCPE